MYEIPYSPHMILYFLEKARGFLTKREIRCLIVQLRRSIWLVKPVSLPIALRQQIGRLPKNQCTLVHIAGK